jgi:DNA primase
MSVIDDVKQRVDIVELVSQYVSLKRAGKSFTAPCPFHTERTPSFHVDPARQTWHCFGACSTGGDIFAFVMKKEGCEFRDALRILAERAGVSLEAQRDTQEDSRRNRLYEVNEAAGVYFQNALTSPGGAAARSYLNDRKISPESIENFQLGYAVQAWDALTRHLEERGFDAKDAVTSGLAIAGERGAYDRFRHRLMFPIRDERGRVAGFGGRALPGTPEDAGGKYVNSSQSPVFDKGALLYALDRAKDAIRNEGAVIVEGYMDVIAAHEHGFSNVVASMGTALTERQVQLLKRYTRNFTLALDADAAGNEATLRGVQVVTDSMDRESQPAINWRGVIRHQETLAADIRVLTMPEGHDPDDVIRADPEQWRQLVASARPVLDHLFDASVSRHDLSSPRERSTVVRELAPLVAMIHDRVVHAHYVQKLARMVHLDEAELRLELKQPVKPAVPRTTRAVPGPSRASVAPSVRIARNHAEEFCLALLFRYPELRAEAPTILPAMFGQSENRALFDAWIEWSDEGESRGNRPTVDGVSFEESLIPDLRAHYERVINLELPSYDDDALAAALRSTLWGIEQQRLRLAKRASVAAVADTPREEAAQIAERARSAWERGATEDLPAEQEADPASAFVDDMETGLRIHQRVLEQQRAAERPAR